MAGDAIELLAESEKRHAIKSGSFGASSLAERHLATADFGGALQTWDLERMSQPLFKAQAHAGIINCMDATGGQVGA